MRLLTLHSLIVWDEGYPFVSCLTVLVSSVQFHVSLEFGFTGFTEYTVDTNIICCFSDWT